MEGEKGKDEQPTKQVLRRRQAGDEWERHWLSEKPDREPRMTPEEKPPLERDPSQSDQGKPDGKPRMTPDTIPQLPPERDPFAMESQRLNKVEPEVKRLPEVATSPAMEPESVPRLESDAVPKREQRARIPARRDMAPRREVPREGSGPDAQTGRRVVKMTTPSRRLDALKERGGAVLPNRPQSPKPPRERSPFDDAPPEP